MAKSSKLPEKHVELIDLMAKTFEQQGLQPIGGRIIGLLLYDERAYSFSEIAELLKISRGSVSTNTKTLVDRKHIERLQYPGDRQDYFRIRSDMRYEMASHMADSIDKVISDFTSLSASFGKSESGPKDRLNNFAEFMTEISVALRSLSREC